MDKTVLRQREYQKKHDLKYPERRLKSKVEYTRRRRAAVIELFGSECKQCGFSDVRALQVDHVHGGGYVALRKIYGSAYWNSVIRSVLAEEGKYQLLCANCNWIKRYTNKESPGRPRVK